MSFDMPPMGLDPDPKNVCGRCGKPLPAVGGLRRCFGKPRSRDDGNVCFKAGA